MPALFAGHPAIRRYDQGRRDVWRGLGQPGFWQLLEPAAAAIWEWIAGLLLAFRTRQRERRRPRSPIPMRAAQAQSNIYGNLERPQHGDQPACQHRSAELARREHHRASPTTAYNTYRYQQTQFVAQPPRGNGWPIRITTSSDGRVHRQSRRPGFAPPNQLFNYANAVGAAQGLAGANQPGYRASRSIWRTPTWRRLGYAAAACSGSIRTRRRGLRRIRRWSVCCSRRAWR